MYKHTIYIPKHDSDRSEQSYLTGMGICSDLVEHLSLYFGSCTVTSCVHHYLKQTDVLMDEAWTIHVIHSSSDIRPNITNFIDLIKTEMKQDFVLITKETVDAYYV